MSPRPPAAAVSQTAPPLPLARTLGAGAGAELALTPEAFAALGVIERDTLIARLRHPTRRLLRVLVAAAVVAVILGVACCSLLRKESIISAGRTVYLELDPAGRQALARGDYGALRYKIETDALDGIDPRKARSGRMIVAVDPRHVATFQRSAEMGGRPDDGEAVLRYHVWDGRPAVVTTTSLSDGGGRSLAGARYAELRVSKEGDAVLVALRGADLQLLTSPPR